MKGTTKETIGYVIEATLFVLAGVFALTSPWRAYLLLILALIMASVVGRQIAKNAIEKYKEDHI